GNGQPRLTSARGDVEMLLIIGDVETLNNRCADRAQLIHDDRVPLLPAHGKPGPRRSLNVSDLVAARHRPSRYRMHPPNTKALLGGSASCPIWSGYARQPTGREGGGSRSTEWRRRMPFGGGQVMAIV